MRRTWTPGPYMILVLCLAGWALIWLAVSALVTSCRAETVAFDYRNSPQWTSIADFDAAVLSPRATAAAESLSLRGVEARFWLQPLAATWRGAPVRSFRWDRDLWAMLDETGGVARRADGDTAVLTVDDVSGAVLVDLARPEVREQWIALARSLGRPLLFDYGCRDLSWEPSIGLSSAQWTAWAAGWSAVKDSLRPLCQCQQWQEQCAGVVLEKVGWSLTPIPRAWELLRAHPGTSVLLAMVDDDRRRRALAAISLLTDSGFNWGFASATPNRKDPEHFDLYLGTFQSSLWERAPGVYMRLSSHGGVVLNLSGSPWTWGSRVIAAEDALVFQRRDPVTGRYIPWRTTGP